VERRHWRYVRARRAYPASRPLDDAVRRLGKEMRCSRELSEVAQVPRRLLALLRDSKAMVMHAITPTQIVVPAASFERPLAQEQQ
jgi:hypothetical protein